MTHLSRRQVLRGSAGAALLMALSACTDNHDGTSDGRKPVLPTAATPRNWLMPEEGAPHSRTWMAFGASADIWGAELLPQVRQDLVRVARAIAAFEPVTMLVRPEETALAKDLLGSDVELLEAALDDLWIRDTGPTFVTAGGAKTGVDFNFNGWGDHQHHEADTRVAGLICAHVGETALTTSLVLEGGALEVDGQGSAIITESCVLNNNRNPRVSKADVEDALAGLLGVSKIIWLPGVAGRDITDGHTDFYARFTGPGHVLATLEPDPTSYDYSVTRRHLEILEAEHDALGRPLTVTTLMGPSQLRAASPAPDFAAGYANFYVCNSAVIAANFGDPTTDDQAQAVLADLYPDRTIVTVDIDAIASGGGGIHCATQQEPAQPTT